MPYGRGHSQPGSLFIHFGAISMLPDAYRALLNTVCASFPSGSRIVHVLATGATASATEGAERPLEMGYLLRYRRHQRQMIPCGDEFDTDPLNSTKSCKQAKCPTRKAVWVRGGYRLRA